MKKLGVIYKYMVITILNQNIIFEPAKCNMPAGFFYISN